MNAANQPAALGFSSLDSHGVQYLYHYSATGKKWTPQYCLNEGGNASMLFLPVADALHIATRGTNLSSQVIYFIARNS